MSDTRLFTVQEANELIPFLCDALEELRLVRNGLRRGADTTPDQQDVHHWQNLNPVA